jgi:hypothetical protein
MYIRAGYFGVACAAVLAGCSSRPSRVELPDFNPQQIGARAVEMYDSDGDGSLGGSELDKVKSLASAMSQLDSDRDQKISAEEIAARIRHYQDYKAGLLSVYCKLMKAGRPVANAKITYEPEVFFDRSILPAYGTTDASGGSVMSVAEEHRPIPAATGVRPGFYRVRVTLANGKEVNELDAGVEAGSGLLNNHTIALP